MLLAGLSTLVTVAASGAAAERASAQSPLLTPQVLSPAGQIDPELPSLVVRPDGSAEVAWLNLAEKAFLARRTTSSGSWVVEHVPGGGGWDRVPFAIDGAERTLVVQRDPTGTGAYPISLRVRSVSGVWSDPVPVTADSGGIVAPVLGTAGDGRVVIAWARRTMDEVGARVWDPATQTLGPETVFGVGGNDAFPDIAVSLAGRLLVLGRYQLEADSSFSDIGSLGYGAIADDGTIAVAHDVGGAGSRSAALTVDPAGPAPPVTRQFARAGTAEAVIRTLDPVGHVVLADGAAIETWREGGAGRGLIRVGEVDIATGVASDAITIDDDAHHPVRGTLDEPFLVASADGTVTLLWRRDYSAGTYSKIETWLATRRPGSSTWSAPHLMLPDDDMQDMSLRAGLDAAGRMTVAWVGWPAGSLPVIVAARFAAAEPIFTPIVVPQLAIAGTPVAMNTRSRKTATWHFGDGRTAVGPTVSHTYQRAGTFTVRAVPHAKAPVTAQLLVVASLGFGITSERLQVRNGRFSVPLSCQANAPRCKGTIEIALSKKRRLRKAFTIAAGRGLSVTFTLPKADRKQLSRKKKLLLTASAKTTFGTAVRRVRLVR